MSKISGKFLIVMSMLISPLVLSDHNPWAALMARQKKEQRCITDENNNQIAIPGETCKAQQDAMIAIKCVDKKHIEYIRQNGVYPLCDVLNRPASACFCGCFAAGSLIWVEHKNTRQQERIQIEKLVDDFKSYRVFALASNSTFSNVVYEKLEINRVIQGPESKPLVVIVTEHARRVRLSEEHALLLANGTMIAAMEVTLGDELVQDNGEASIVVKILREKTFGYVYNIVTSSEDMFGHIVVADGLLTGDLKWQNALPMDISSIAIAP